jgi:hypothetical protein
LIPKQYAAHLIFDALHERAAKFTPIMSAMDDRAVLYAALPRGAAFSDFRRQGLRPFRSDTTKD